MLTKSGWDWLEGQKNALRPKRPLGFTRSGSPPRGDTCFSPSAGPHPGAVERVPCGVFRARTRGPGASVAIRCKQGSSASGRARAAGGEAYRLSRRVHGSRAAHAPGGDSQPDIVRTSQQTYQDNDTRTAPARHSVGSMRTDRLTPPRLTIATTHAHAHRDPRRHLRTASVSTRLHKPYRQTHPTQRLHAVPRLSDSCPPTRAVMRAQLRRRSARACRGPGSTGNAIRPPHDRAGT